MSSDHGVPAAIVYAVAYIILGIALIWRCINARSKWGLCLGIGAVCQGVGFVIRIVFRYNMTSIPLYAIQQLVIVVSPACYFAFNYILFGRLAYNMGQDERFQTRKSLTFIKAQYMGAFFVTSDIITFIMQMAGGGMQAVPGLATVGDPLFLAGIVAQFASYVIFLFLIARFRFWVLPHLRKIDRKQSNIGKNVDKVMLLIGWSSIWIVVRCVFRTIELAEGYHGKIYNNEIFFLTLDALPLVLAIAHYLIYWPNDFVPLGHNEHGFSAMEMEPLHINDDDQKC